MHPLWTQHQEAELHVQSSTFRFYRYHAWIPLLTCGHILEIHFAVSNFGLVCWNDARLIRIPGSFVFPWNEDASNRRSARHARFANQGSIPGAKQYILFLI